MSLLKKCALGAAAVLVWIFGGHTLLDSRKCDEHAATIKAVGKTTVQAVGTAFEKSREAVAANYVAPKHEPTPAELTNALLAKEAVEAAKARQTAADAQRSFQEAMTALMQSQAKQTDAISAIPQVMDGHFSKMTAELGTMSRKAEARDAQQAALDKAIAEMVQRAADAKLQAPADSPVR